MRCVLICALVFTSFKITNALSAVDRLQFNTAFLNDESEERADLAWVSSGSSLPPGEYNVNVYINKRYAFTSDVIFKNDNGVTTPCMTQQQITSMGIDFSQSKIKMHLGQHECLFLRNYFPDASFHYDITNLTLNFTLPQSNMLNLPRGYISPESRDHGISSAWINYQINGSKNHSRGFYDSTQQLFIGLNSGINFGPWRIRDYSTWMNNGRYFRHLQSWIQRDVSYLNSQLYVGETFTSSQIFDPVGLSGVALSSDDNMLPASLNGYAPEVHGIARSHADVTVRQSGNIIYQTSVPPGEFAIVDLYPTSSGGDLEVTIQENDGNITRYVVPFASVPSLVRNGHVKYSIGMGEFRPNTNQDDPTFIQAELFVGLRYGLTFYSGVQLSRHYRGLAFGSGQNLGVFGAYSLDIIHAQSKLADSSYRTGDSLRLRYSKLLNNAGTRLNFFSQRYSTQGFYTLSDTAYKNMNGGDTGKVIDKNGIFRKDYSAFYNLRMKRKIKNQLLLTQHLGALGSLSLSFDRQSYWNASKSTEGILVAWNSTFHNTSFSLSAQHTSKLYDHKKDNLLMLSISVPLSSSQIPSRLRYTTSGSVNGGTVHSAGISGYIPGYDDFFYSANHNFGRQLAHSGNAAIQYQGPKGNYNVGLNYASKFRNLSYGINGGAVLHEDGLTLSQPLGNSNILVKAKGAKDLAILNHKGIRTDSYGYAVIPHATPYRINQVALDTAKIENDVEIDNAILKTIPTEGAMVRKTLKVRLGAKAMFSITRNRKPLPFGTLITFEDKSSGIVGDGGTLYIYGLSKKGKLKGRWGRGNDQACTINYELEDRYFNTRTGLYSQEVVCI